MTIQRTTNRGAPADHITSVLVVDDDEDVRESVSLVLADEGYRVVTANDGADALRTLEEQGTPCLILLDLIMPRMDGLMFLERLQADERFARVPVAIFSAGSILRPPRGYPFLAKPVAVERLLAVVGSHCQPPDGGGEET